MEEDSFDAAVKFIIEKMILYKEYQFMAPMYVSNLCKLQNMDEALKVLRFLYDKIAMISNRDVSRETLRSILEIDYLIPGNLIELFFRRIDTNYSELNQAHLIIRFNTLLNKVERFENFIEEMESKDSNKE
ncbi:MAG TPA: hypothetical protein DHV55_01210 [Clostridiaceae bacterium]|nr:hypothetical protein [Clostridiaceae bacterium]